MSPASSRAVITSVSPIAANFPRERVSSVCQARAILLFALGGCLTLRMSFVRIDHGEQRN